MKWSLCDGTARFYTKEVRPRVLMCFSGNAYADELWFALILSSLCCADILPGTVTALCCEAAGAGRGGGAGGVGPVVDSED